MDEAYLDILYLYNGTTQTKIDISEIANGAFAVSGVQLANGLNYISAVAIDKAGNKSSMMITITHPQNVDTTAPYIYAPIKRCCVNTSTFTVSGYIDDNTATVTVNGINAIVVDNSFTLDYPLILGPNTITIKATDPSGNTSTYTFTITYDITLPTVISTGPAFNATDVPIDSAITVTFNETMSANTIYDSTFTISSEAGSVAGTITYGTNSATFTPSNKLKPNTVYTAIIRGGSNGVSDAAGNRLATDYAWVFKTLTLPIEITEPYDGATINKSTTIIKGTINYATQDIGITVNGVVAEINGQNWTAIVPLQAGVNSIEARATDSSGNTATHTITVNTESTDQPLTISTNPQSGIAALNTTFIIDVSISNTVIGYKIDFEGDGVTDLTTTRPENITHIYATPGTYYPTVSGTDNQGNTYTETTAINVHPKEEMDTLLKSKWEGMKGAMGRGDVAAALNYFSDYSKQLYSDLFTALASQFPQIVQDMQDIQLIYLKNNAAKYRIRKNEMYGGQMLTVTYYIYFSKDKNGLWKIDKF